MGSTLYTHAGTCLHSLTSSDGFCLLSGVGRSAKRFEEVGKVMEGQLARVAKCRVEVGGILWEGHGEVGGG